MASHTIGQIMLLWPKPPALCPVCDEFTECMTSIAAYPRDRDRIGSLAHYVCDCGWTWNIRWTGEVV